MKPLKENKLLKWVYAYVDLVYKLLPFVVALMIVPSIVGWIVSRANGDNYSFQFVFVWGLENGNEVSAQNLLSKIIIALHAFAFWVLLFIALKNLVSFLRNVFEDKPFKEENGKYLKYIGIIIIFITVYSSIMKVVLHMASLGPSVSKLNEILLNTASFLSILLNPYIFVGMLSIVMGEIILHGHKIKEEVDLTV